MLWVVDILRNDINKSKFRPNFRSIIDVSLHNMELATMLNNFFYLNAKTDFESNIRSLTEKKLGHTENQQPFFKAHNLYNRSLRRMSKQFRFYLSHCCWQARRYYCTAH